MSLFLLCLALAWLSCACSAPQATQALVTISVTADGQTYTLQLPAGSTVQQALDVTNLKLNELDRTEPSTYTVLREGGSIRVIRVSEEFDIEELVIPFEIQTLRNETLPQGEEVLIQKGKNGLQEITYRRVFEDGVEISSQPIPVKSVIVEEPTPEIRMIGIQTPFTPVAIPGKLIYLRDGNAWLMDGSTANRQVLIATGDLDGRVFSLSPDGNWFLFTRAAEEEGQINTLWAKKIGGAQETPAENEEEAQVDLFDLGISNIIHFADWVAEPEVKLVFSTVEPRSTAPGWQANNDLNAIQISDTGWKSKWTVILEANSGGVYGWWGTNFIWGPDNQHLTYARPGSVGTLNIKTGETQTLFDIVPLLTRGDWAWSPGIAWGPDGKTLYAINHISSPGAASPEESPNFDLIAIPARGGPALTLATQTGMFAYPIASPIQAEGAGGNEYQIAYLQAIFPEQSETSRYRLVVMDRDASNRKTLFPAQEALGLEPQRYWGNWSPARMPESNHFALAILYQGNLWLIDAVNGKATQITGDGLTSRIIWR